MKTSKVILMLATVALSMSMLIASTNVQPETLDNSKAITTLVGSVLDAETDEGIAGANVTVADSDSSATTDEYGTFTIENLEEGTHRVSVSAEGYSSAEKEVEITEEEGGSVEFLLETEEK